jgi:hypothetical protein
MSVNKIRVCNRPGSEDRLTVGANTQILLNDNPVEGVSFFKFEVKATKMAKVTMEMYAEVDIDINAELELVSSEPTEYSIGDKKLDLHTLSNYGPVAKIPGTEEFEVSIRYFGKTYTSTRHYPPLVLMAANNPREYILNDILDGARRCIEEALEKKND